MKRFPGFCAALVLIFGTLAVSGYAQITPSADAYTDTASPGTNFGNQPTLNVASASQTSYIKFNLASIPAGYTSTNVAKATLKLYVNAVTTAGSFNVDFVSGTWGERAITANLAPALGTTIAGSVPLTTSSAHNYILIDVTSAVDAWLSGSEPNDGIALVANSPLNASFDSKESTTQSQPAELDLVLTGTGTGTITGVTTGAGSGLAGGGTKGALNLTLTKSCAANQTLQWSGSAWACSSAGAGTITSVTAGTDLTGGGGSGNVTLNLNTAATDARYAQLGSANSFTGNETVTGNVSATGTVSGGLGSFSGNSSNSILNVVQKATSGPGFAVVGTSSNANSHQAAVLGQELAAGKNVFGVEGSVFGPAGAGVYGQNGQSVLGATTSGGAGIWGDTGSANVFAVLGTADKGNAVVGFNNSSAGYGAIVGENNSASSIAPGVVGLSAGTVGIGTIGAGFSFSKNFNNNVGFNPVGVVGDSSAATGIGVWGSTDSGTSVYGSTGSGLGVYGLSSSGTGVQGYSAGATGVYGQSDATGGVALYGFATAGDGVLGDSDTGTGVSASSTYASAITGVNNSDVYETATFINNSVDTWFAFLAGSNAASCTISTTGHLSCDGGTSSVVALSNNRRVQLYSMQSPENWFEDFGSASLAGGSAAVALEPTFRDTVNSAADYHVFLTPNGDCKGLYVAEKTPSGFSVRELGGGQSNITFDYRIVVRRKGYENVRLADVTEIHERQVAGIKKTMMQPLHRQVPAKPARGQSKPQTNMPILQRPIPAKAIAVPALPVRPAVPTINR